MILSLGDQIDLMALEAYLVANVDDISSCIPLLLSIYSPFSAIDALRAISFLWWLPCNEILLNAKYA